MYIHNHKQFISCFILYLFICLFIFYFIYLFVYFFIYFFYLFIFFLFFFIFFFGGGGFNRSVDRVLTVLGYIKHQITHSLLDYFARYAAGVIYANSCRAGSATVIKSASVVAIYHNICNLLRNPIKNVKYVEAVYDIESAFVQ